jgi:hypothetical protein
MSDVRKATDKILEMVDEGILDKDTVIMSCLKYMSEDDVADMAHCNEFFLNEEEDSEFTDEDGNPISEDEQGRADAEADRLDKGEDD